jgi:hypothetical protein
MSRINSYDSFIPRKVSNKQLIKRKCPNSTFSIVFQQQSTTAMSPSKAAVVLCQPTVDRHLQSPERIWQGKYWRRGCRSPRMLTSSVNQLLFQAKAFQQQRRQRLSSHLTSSSSPKKILGTTQLPKDYVSRLASDGWAKVLRRFESITGYS